ncbi:MAG: sugar phosphate nucleotidyltransferase [Dongiaceae bacterium]
MQALILAGGKGTRLRPYTTVIPKPLMPVGDLPILEIILRQLKRAGVIEVILAVGYMGQMFQAFFADGARLGLRISYSFEEQALGTAGPIALALDRLQDNFLMMNGDLLTTLDYSRLFAAHCRSGAAATIGMYRREVEIDFGVIKADAHGRLADYIEKPIYQFDVSMGVNALNVSAVRKYLTAGVHLDIPGLMMKMKTDGLTVNCFTEPCYWLDIGRIDDYETANEIFESRKAEFLPGPGAQSDRS